MKIALFIICWILWIVNFYYDGSHEPYLAANLVMLFIGMKDNARTTTQYKEE